MESVRTTIGAALAARYSIERELGGGTMAVVFLAHDRKHDRQVAIKALKPELASAIGADRFQREIEVLAGLTHPHILPLHDSGVADGLLYFVMPYIEGRSLQARLLRDGRLPIPDAIRIAREIAGALGFAHRRGIVHRDVKPGNILLAEDHALLADFGIAHLAETAGGTLTGTGLALGTPAYFSPEQATGEQDIDGRSDIYSLGCVLYETLTGEPPFTATNVRALIAHHLVDAPPRVRDRRPEVSEGIEAVVQTALRKEPEKRFQAAEEMAGSLDLVSGGFEAAAARALRKLIGPKHRWLHGWRLAGLVAAAVVVMVGAGIWVRAALRPPVFTGFYPTYAILPYEGAELTEEELRWSHQGARELRVHLRGWASLVAIDPAALEGPRTTVALAGLGMPTTSLSAGIETAEKAGASHLVYVEAKSRADSLELLATVYALYPLRQEMQLESDGSEEDIGTVAAGIALDLLGVHGEPADIDDLLLRSPNHLAHQQFDRGREALHDWRLAEAEQHFLDAIAEDPEFALAHYYLATTMYWRTVRDEFRLLESGETIHYHVERADQFGTEARLRPWEQREVDAFRSFWAGDYDTARARYDSILERDPLNLEALVLAGSVEFDDPWATRESGELVPRGDLNRARALFDSAVSLDNHQQLAWGRLFDLNRRIAGTAYEGHCWSFQPPGGPPIRPYEFAEASEAQGFCPYMEEGSIRWEPVARVGEARRRAILGVGQLQAGILRRLDFWTNVEHDQPRPHEELADWVLWERSLGGCGTEEARSDSLLREGLRHTRTALEIRRDTTPEDRIRLATLLLPTGDVESAIGQVERALAALGDWQEGEGQTPPVLAASAFLATGRGHPTAEILERGWNPGSWATRDGSEGGWIDGGPVNGTVWALGALGLSTSPESDISDRFETLERTWSTPPYTRRQRALLRRATTYRVSPALVRVPALRAEWFAEWDEYGIETPVAWRGLLAADSNPAEAELRLREAVTEIDADTARAPNRYDFYLPIVLAEAIGADSIAGALKARARTCPMRLESFDLGWGMQNMLTRDEEDL